jgi:hypothetical protein
MKIIWNNRLQFFAVTAMFTDEFVLRVFSVS